MRRIRETGWAVSGVLHAGALLAGAWLGCTAWQVPQLSLPQGTIQLVASYSAAVHSEPLHVHLPGLTQDHMHPDQPATIHRHAPAETPQTQQPEVPLTGAQAVPALPTPARLAPEEDVPSVSATPPGTLPRSRQALAEPQLDDSLAAEALAGVSVDEMPRAASDNPPPEYPPEAVRAGLTGRVVLEVEISADGRVGRARVAVSSGQAVLDAAALRSIKRWRFSPARRGGEPVAYTVRVPLRFSLRE